MFDRDLSRAFDYHSLNESKHLPASKKPLPLDNVSAAKLFEYLPPVQLIKLRGVAKFFDKNLKTDIAPQLSLVTHMKRGTLSRCEKAIKSKILQLHAERDTLLDKIQGSYILIKYIVDLPETKLRNLESKALNEFFDKLENLNTSWNRFKNKTKALARSYYGYEYDSLCPECPCSYECMCSTCVSSLIYILTPADWLFIHSWQCWLISFSTTCAIHTVVPGIYFYCTDTSFTPPTAHCTSAYRSLNSDILPKISQIRNLESRIAALLNPEDKRPNNPPPPASQRMMP